jgi:predicted dehydrogenase
MKQLKFGIIGVGNMGTAHLNCLKSGEIAGATVTAICDINGEKCRVLKEKYPDLDIYNSSEELLASADIDAIIIATPHKSHADIAEMALKAGKNVMVEKPVDITLSKAKRLNQVAKESGKSFGIMFNQRTNPLFVKAREIVKSGKLGKLKRSVWIVTNWYRTQAYYDSGDWRATWRGEGGGVLLNQAPHNLDIWQWICGMPTKVQAKCQVAKYHNIEVEDEAVISAEFENGANGIFITSTGEYPGTNRLEISGTLGKIVLENNMLKFWSLKQNEEEFRYSSKEGFPSIETDYTEIIPQGEETAHKGILQNFTNNILFGEELIAPGYDGEKELTISNAAYLSAWNGGQEITLPFDLEEFDRQLAVRAENSSYHQNNGGALTGEGYSPRWSVRW